jgi:tetratricopeptide (TPR) repeat protein
MMSRYPGWLGQLVALLLVLGTARVGRAQDAPSPKLSEAQKRQTKDHYEKATKYYNLGKYAEAVAEYQAAYLISADPVMLYNIAQCHRLNSQPEDAARFYKNYLRNAPSAPNRAEVEKKIEEMERLAEEKRRQSAASPGGPGEPAPPPPPGPGEVGAGPAPPPVTPPETTPPRGGPEASVGQSLPATPVEPPSRILPLSLLIGGGTLVATSLVFGAVAVSKSKQVEEKASAGSRFDESVKNLEKTGKAASGLAVLTGLVGLAAGATGAYFWFRSGPAESSAATVYPLAAPGLAGAGVHLTF